MSPVGDLKAMVVCTFNIGATTFNIFDEVYTCEKDLTGDMVRFWAKTINEPFRGTNKFTTWTSYHLTKDEFNYYFDL